MATGAITTTAFSTGISTEDDSFKAGQEAANKAAAKFGTRQPQFGIVFASSKYNYNDVLRGVRSVAGTAQIIGCSSAGEFTEESVTKESVACAFLNSENHKFFTGLGSGIRHDQKHAIEQASLAFPKEVPGFPSLCTIMLIDGLAGVGEDMCNAAASVMGSQMRFVGGAAGDDLKLTQTSVFHDNQSSSDSVALALVASKKPMFIGVRHGHSGLSSELKITKSNGSVVQELEGKPAFAVWKDHTRARAKEKGMDVDALKTPSEIGNFLLQYEAGVLQGTEYKLRAPLSVNADGSLNFVCTMKEGTSIKIMETPNRYYQIASAKTAAETAFEAAKGAKLAGAIVFDCVCRGAILDKDYYKSVDEIKKVVGNIPLIGFATYGEIAMDPGQLFGFHNTTTVVLLIPE
jgi:methyl-accepting chemotaxis protein